MKKYLYDYIDEMDKLIESKKIDDLEQVKKEHLKKISFFQHERLIHLLVTLFYFIFFMLFVGLGILFWAFFIIAFMILVIELFYIVHYFRLENGVQYLYKQYDMLNNYSKNVNNTFLSVLGSKMIDKFIDRF